MMLTAFGRERPIGDWAKDLGIPTIALYARVHVFKWKPERAVTVPPARPRGYARRTWLFLSRAGLMEKCKRDLGISAPGHKP
jgi:hypothetical protein